MRRIRAAAAAALLLLAPAGCQRDAAAPAPVARFALNTAPEGFDPRRAFRVTEGILQRQLLEALTEYDPAAPEAARARPLLAESWTRDETGLTWAFTLRADARFHDPHEPPLWPERARAVEAADVVASFVLHADPRANTWDAYQGLFEGLDALRAELLAAGDAGAPRLAAAQRDGVAGIRALDSRRVELRLARPDGFLLQRLASQAFAVIPRERALGSAEDRRDRPVGSGPFVLAAWQPGQGATMRRAPDWREPDAGGPGAPAGELRFDFVRETAVRSLLFEEGRLDRMSLALDAFARFVDGGELRPEGAARGWRLTRLQVPDTTLLVFNVRDPAIGSVPGDEEADRRRVALRRALALAFPRDGWHRLVRNSTGAVAARTLLPPLLPEAAALPDFPWLGPDLAAAAAQLEAAGHGGGAGLPELVFDLVSDDPVTLSLGELYVANLRGLGVRCRAQPNPWQSLIARAARGEFQITLQAWTLDWPDAAMMFALFASSGIGGETNLAQFADARYDAALDALRAAADPAERARRAAELAGILAERVPAMPVDHRVSHLLHQPWLRGAEGHPFDPLPCKFIRLEERP